MQSKAMLSNHFWISMCQDQMQKRQRKNKTRMVYSRHPKSCLLSGSLGLGVGKEAGEDGLEVRNEII